MSSSLRATVRAIAYLLLTLPIMPLQLLAVSCGWRLAATKVPRLYHRWCCWLLGVTVAVRGAPAGAKPTLYVVNHQSYLDIPVLSAVVEVSFVAKREVASWPFFGWLAKLQRTVFVERRATSIPGERDELTRRLAAGDNIVLFPEGTSDDGTRLRPFKSAFFSAAEILVNDQPLVVQPVTIAYTRLDELPLGRQWRPFVAWYGDMDILSHIWELIGLGRITVEVIFHPPATIMELGSRKALASHCERLVAQGLAAAYAGRWPAEVAPAAPAVPAGPPPATSPGLA